MIITYFRSSSYNNWDFCQMQYFITYVLGWSSPSGQKAEQGTIVHKVLECLASMKKSIQSDPNCLSIEDEHLGLIHFSEKALLERIKLTDSKVDEVNKSRRNKQTYISPGFIKSGHERVGEKLVEEIFERSFDHYTSKSIHKWQPAHRRDCLNYVWMALDYKKGIFDPRLRDIVDTEPHFDIEIDRPWAKFDYVTPTGEEISGNLAIKGTIDLITRVDDGILEIVDWKTGQRLDWANKSRSRDIPKKTYEKLCKDPQLMLYYYASKHLYPDEKHIMATMFFVRDGGAFSVCLEDLHMEELENMLEHRYREIRNSVNPKLISPNHADMKCKYLCAFAKNKFANSDLDNMCHHVRNEIDEKGIDFVTLQYTKPGHKIGNYEAPGE